MNWSDDDLVGTAVERVKELTAAQIAFRDNEAPPPVNAGAARARRLEAIKTELAACQAIIDDCDFMADDLKTTSCMGAAVPQMMRDYLAYLRSYEVDRKRLLEAEHLAKRAT